MSNSRTLKRLFLFNCFIMMTFVWSCESDKKSESIPVSDFSLYYPIADANYWDPSWSDSSKVIVQILADPDNLHPTNGSSQIRDEVLQYLHRSLIKTDLEKGGMKADILESMPSLSDDKSALTFKLKNGVCWDNGSQVLANDVIFTIKASLCELTNNVSNKFFFENIKDVKINDVEKLSFTIYFKSPSEYNLPMWCDYPILQESKYDFNNTLNEFSFKQFNDSTFNQANNPKLKAWAMMFNSDEMGKSPNLIAGLGPYQLERWEQGQFISIVKKSRYWDAANSTNIPNKIVFRIAQDPVVQKSGFLSQLFDASGAFPTRLLLDLQKDTLFTKNYHSKFVNTYGYTYIAINTKPENSKRTPILNDLKVRRALAFSSQIDNMINVVNKGVNKRVAGPVSPIKKECNSDLMMIPFDVSTAKMILVDAGWVDKNNDGIRDKMINGKSVPLSLDLIYMNTIPDWKEMAIIIAEGMKQAGVQINPIACDYPTWLEKVSQHNFDLAMGSWNTSSFPEDYSQLWSTESYNGNGSNYTGFGNSSSDSLIVAIAKETNPEKKMLLEKKMQQLIYDQQPYIFMYGLVRRCVLHKRFSNIRFYAERPGIIYSDLRLNSLRHESSVNN